VGGAVAIVAVVALTLVLPAAATAASRTACLNRTNTTQQALLECVTLEGVRAHQAAFQDIVGTLAPEEANIPVVGASFANGSALAPPGSTARIHVEERADVNVIAELPGKNSNNVVMAGAHLDSVPEDRASTTTAPARQCSSRPR
jgi:acetylornithine deacetylase/succinyl-diaminopimelate desuccinylase-like protein